MTSSIGGFLGFRYSLWLWTHTDRQSWVFELNGEDFDEVLGQEDIRAMLEIQCPGHYDLLLDLKATSAAKRLAD